ncbi:MAG TPA: hypothetical protein PK668_27755 [Myxococcota bacterium]|nr:hypothetical protein [Myxococcota bacterium]HRY95466.1 hypothetical protein [Myxococcota bacterium]HSA21159.1 hypothetical protein [Myxococcota bacterium]
MATYIEEFRELIASEFPKERERAADEVTDIHRGVGDAEAVEFARILVAARLVEPDLACQEAQLHAICDLMAWHHIPAEAVMPLKELRGKSDLGAQEEYLEDIIGKPP